MADNYQITVTLSGRDDLSDELRQANQNLSRFSDNAKEANNASNQAQNGFSGLGNVVRTVATAFSAMEIARTVIDLNNLGMEVTAVKNTFEELSGGPEAAAKALDNMRQITGGVVDDFTLMSGANSLLLTGLADTNDKAAELVNLGFRLSAAMGVDAKEGIENLNAALLNNSFARLDTLGISAAAVRERVNELKEAGMDMSDAFAQAVLEQGNEKLLALGDAAGNAETSVNRLATQFTNLKQSVGEFVAQGVEAGAQLVELGMLAGQVGLGNVLDAAGGQSVNLGNQAIADQATAIRNDRLGGNFGMALGTQNSVDTLGLVDMAQSNPDLFNRISGGSAFSNMVYGSPEAVTQQTGIAPEGMQAIFENLTGVNFDNLNMEEAAVFAAELDTQLNAVATTLQTTAEAEARAAEQQAQLNDALALASERSQEYTDLEAQRLLNQEAANRAASEEQGIFESLNNSYSTLISAAGDFQSIGGIQIMDPDEAAQIVNTAEVMETRFETLKDIAEETDFEYISEDELAWAEEMARQAGDLADNAERAAAAFEGMSLSEMFGQSGGGRLGELSDMVLSGIQDPEQQAAMQRQFDMASGRETDVSTAFSDQIVPLLTQITTELGTGAGVDATERALAALEEGRLAGLTGEELINSIVTAIGITQTDAGLQALPAGNGQDMMNMANGEMPLGYGGFGAPGTTTLSGTPNGQDMMNMANGEMPLGFSGGATGEENAPGSDVEMMTEQTLLLNDQIAIASESLGALVATDLTGVMDPFIHSFTTAEEATNVIQAQLDSMAGKTYTTTLRIQVLLDDPTGLGLATNPAFGAAVGGVNENNGGSSPGTSGPQ